MECGGVFARTGIWPRCVAAPLLVRPYPALPVPAFNLWPGESAISFRRDVLSDVSARVTSPRFQNREQHRDRNRDRTPPRTTGSDDGV